LIFPKDDLTASCYLKVLNDFFFYVFSKFSDWQNMKSIAVSSLECVSALTRSTWAQHEASGRQLAHCFAGDAMRVQVADSLPGELPLSVALQGHSGSHAREDAGLVHQVSAQERRAAAAVEASAAPPSRTPNSSPAAATDGPRPKRGMALSDDEGQAGK
jgi:hypothetical protein